jgi:hypothetical protein
MSISQSDRKRNIFSTFYLLVRQALSGQQQDYTTGSIRRIFRGAGNASMGAGAYRRLFGYPADRNQYYGDQPVQAG